MYFLQERLKYELGAGIILTLVHENEEMKAYNKKLPFKHSHGEPIQKRKQFFTAKTCRDEDDKLELVPNVKLFDPKIQSFFCESPTS